MTIAGTPEISAAMAQTTGRRNRCVSANSSRGYAISPAVRFIRSPAARAPRHAGAVHIRAERLIMPHLLGEAAVPLLVLFILRSAEHSSGLRIGTVEDVRAWKAASGRPKDLRDVEAIDRFLTQRRMLNAGRTG